MSIASRLPLAALGAFALGWHTVPLSIEHPASSAGVAPLPADRPLASLVPAQSLLYAEIQRPAELLASGLDHPLARTVLESPLGVALAAAMGAGPRESLARLDLAIGFEVLPTLAKLSAKGVSLSVGALQDKPVSLLILRGEDALLLENTLDRTLEVVARQAGFPGAFDEPAVRHLGAEIWRIGDELAIARRDTLLLVCTDEEVLRGSLALAADPEAKGLAGIAGFQTAAAAQAGGEFLWGWLDMAASRAYQERVGGDQSMARWAAAAAEPGAQFFLGPGLSVLGRAKGMTIAISLKGEDLDLSLTALEIDAGSSEAVLPPGGTQAIVPLPGGESNLAQAVFYRDLAGLMRDRNRIFAAQLQPKFAEAESNLALLFGGMDVTEELLPKIGPWIAAVARPARFDPRAVPEVPLPALALLAQVEDPEDVGADLVAAFQTTIGLTNVDRAQKNQDSLRLALQRLGDVTITTARFRPPDPEGGVDLRYNLEPACALVGHTFVIGTHASLVEELVAELEPGTPLGEAPKGESLRLVGAPIAELVEQNRELLVMNGVLKEGKSREQAESEVELLREAARLVAALELGVTYPGERSVCFEVRLDLCAPERPR